jgi:hypothetical protein
MKGRDGKEEAPGKHVGKLYVYSILWFRTMKVES